MSAVPLAVLAFGGTSDLASSVALYLSANAGPAKATAAPSASAANMVLVMLSISLLTRDGADFPTTGNWLYSRKCLLMPQIFHVSKFDSRPECGSYYP